MRKWLVRIFLLAVLAGVGWSGWRVYHRAPETEITAVQPKTGPLTMTVSATGKLAPTTEVLLGCEISGTVDHISVEPNDRVTAGQEIARLKPELIMAEHEQAQADVAAAEARLRQLEVHVAETKRQYERVTALQEKGAASDEELKVRRAAYLAAQADEQAGAAAVMGAKRRIEHTKYRLDRTVITSPINGIVLDRRVDVGQTVAAALMAPELFVLAEDLNHMELLTDVSEADVGYICPGQSASFTVNAYRDRTFKGVVRQVRNQPKAIGSVVTYTVRIDVSNEEQLLRPGMPADVTIQLVHKEELMKLPNAALRFRPPIRTEEYHRKLQDLRWPAEPTPITVTADIPVQTRPAEVSIVPPPIRPAKGSVWQVHEGEWMPIPVWTLFTDNRETAIAPGGALAAEKKVVTEFRVRQSNKSVFEQAIMLARPENRNM